MRMLHLSQTGSPRAAMHYASSEYKAIWKGVPRNGDRKEMQQMNINQIFLIEINTVVLSKFVYIFL